MKTTKLFIGMATVVLAFAACSKINPAPQERSLEPFTLSADAASDEDEADAPEMRTYSKWDSDLRTRTVNWNSADKLSVFDSEKNNNELVLSSGSGSASASFTGSISLGSTATYALFPYNDGATISDAGIISTTIPSEQLIGNEQSWGVNSSVSVGTIAAGKTALKNVCGLIRVIVPNYHVYSVTLSAKENLVGDVEIDYNAGAPTSTIVANGSKSVTYMAKAGKSIYANAFWFCVVPGDYTGITVTVKYSDSRPDSVFGDPESATALTVVRAKASNLGILNIADEVITLDFSTNIITNMASAAMSLSLIHI